MVSLVRPEVAVKEQPKPEPREKPKHRPVRPRPVKAPEPPPTLAAPEESPAPAPVQVPVVRAPAPPMEVPAVPAREPGQPMESESPPAPPAPVTPPRYNADYLSNPAPEYPRLSRRLGEEGRVLLRVFVTAEGLPSKVEVKTSSGFPRLDESAVQTVWHWKFVPARRADQPLAAWVLVPINFTLRS